jgi:hypothetical protein
MIPPRRLSGENCENGVSYRVAICRKRLRVSRMTPRAHSNPGDGIELIPTPPLDAYSLTSPGVANELTARQLLSRQTELAANPGVRDLAEVGIETGGTPDVAAQEKAEDA